MNRFRLIFILICSIFTFTTSAFGLPFDFFDIDWKTRYVDYPQNFVNGTVITGEWAREEDKDKIYFNDSNSGVFDKIAGYKIEKINYTFNTRTMQLHAITFTIGFDPDIKQITQKRLAGLPNIEYPSSLLNTVITDLCAYFSEGYGTYEKYVSTKGRGRTTFASGLNAYVSYPKIVFYEWFDGNTYVLMDVMTTEFLYKSTGKRKTSQTIKVKITDTYPM
ncbi:hypothetical protein HF883_10160 [Cloacibacillus porcorum]|uniref:hypothetical protein n=1 Tax=Cloacibacillus porcorum TaxID=1197717 RepID=UPI001459448D|nr:hypothetical protein [Cloacibacillus porcorum]NMF18584.1 hypothetical protein [Cloacibacillus porcorum]